jgi:TolB-like protein
MSLFAELKRRNVHRMALLYVVAAWLVMQVAEVLIGLVNLPDWLGPTLLTLLAIGFPIALIFSWFFEVTPEGLSLEKDVPAGQSITRATGRRMDFVLIAILAAGLILFAYDKWWPRGPEELSIAVLPFENMSEDPNQEYFSDGISEEILNLLAQIRPLKVIARTSSFAFKGKTEGIAAIAQELNVRHILEGSVRKAGNRVRITAQLIDARDSSHLWSQTFDRDYSAENLFYVQSEIARAITDRLRMTLTGEDEARLANVPTKNTEAYAAYLLGRQRLTDRKVEGLADAVTQFARAIELDPQFAGAYSGLVDACSLYDTYSGGHGHGHCPSSAAEREQLARKAVELDPESGEAWVSLGLVISEQCDDSLESMPKLREAITAYERGLELNPNMSQGYHWYGMAVGNYIFLYPDPPRGWFEAWKAGIWQSVYDKGLEVDPLSIPLHYLKARYPWVARSKEEAIWHGRRMVEIAPDSPRGYETLGEQAWNLQGRIDESIRWESKALEMDPQHPSFPMSMGHAYSALGDPDMALAYFDLARTLTAPNNESAQHELLVEQAMIRLVSGNEDIPQFGELQALLSESTSGANLWLKMIIDLATGNPADALARTKALSPKCFTADDFMGKGVDCPTELVRVYQELGNHTMAQELADELVRYYKIYVDTFQWEEISIGYAAALAVAGQTDEALDVLESAVTSGWRGHYASLLRFTLYFNVNFDAIHDDARFQALVATIEADMAQQLENVRDMQRRGEVPTLEELQSTLRRIEEASTATSDAPESTPSKL